jgi:hypothetical protein
MTNPISPWRVAGDSDAALDSGFQSEPALPNAPEHSPHQAVSASLLRLRIDRHQVDCVIEYDEAEL